MLEFFQNSLIFAFLFAITTPHGAPVKSLAIFGEWVCRTLVRLREPPKLILRFGEPLATASYSQIFPHPLKPLLLSLFFNPKLNYIPVAVKP